MPAAKPLGAGSTVVASHGAGIHPQGAVAACKRPLASQPSCLHLPGSSSPKAGMGISGCCAHPTEELIPLYKGLVLKGHQEYSSGMVGGPGTHANGREMSRGAWLQGWGGGHTKIEAHKAFGREGRSAEKLSPAPDCFHPSQSCPCRRHSRALAHHTPIGVYVFLFKPLQM